MTEPQVLKVPRAGETIAIVRQHDDIADAFRTIKDLLGLSDAFCDQIGGIAVGHTNKCLGPTGTKKIGPVPFNVFCELFAVEFHMVINLDAVKRMADRWERRNEERVRIENRKPSKVLIERAKPHVLQQMGRKGGLKSASLPIAQQVRRKGGKARAKKLSKARRQEIAKAAGKASALARAIQKMGPTSPAHGHEGAI